MEAPPVKRALISVSNKLGIVDFAQGLVDQGIEIYSTGGTRRHLEASGVPVVDVAAYTQFPEMMDGRVKTLHPKIFAGILCRHHLASDREALAEHEIKTFELVIVNLYPFAATVARPNILQSEAIEQIDIGGPSLIRAAAKNSDFTTVVCNPGQYSSVLDEIESEGRTSSSLRHRLMVQAFLHTAEYDKRSPSTCLVKPKEKRFRRPCSCISTEKILCGMEKTAINKPRCTSPATAMMPTWSTRVRSTASNFRTITCWTWTVRWLSCGALIAPRAL